MAHGERFVGERLADTHDVSAFNCGVPVLDEWLKKSARDSDGRRITGTWVWHGGDGVVIAYYSLMPYTIQSSDLSKKHKRGMPSLIPCYLLARLALHDDPALRNQRLGSALLADALTRAATAAGGVGGRYIVVDAINDDATSFYLHHGFVPVAPDVQDRLLIRVKDVIAQRPDAHT